METEEKKEVKVDKAKKYEEVTQKYGDPWLWGIYFTLIIISILETYSASSREVATAGVYSPLIKHCVFLFFGGVCVFFLYRIPYNNKNFMFFGIFVLFLVTIASLLYVMMFGEVINGAQRAIRLFGITVQPAELAKISSVTMLSYILARNQQKNDVSNTGLVLSAVVAGAFGLLMVQSGLTNFVLLAGVSLFLLIIGGTSLKKVIWGLGLLAVFGGMIMLIKNHNDKQEDNLRGNQIEAQIVEEGETPKVDRSNMRNSRMEDWKAWLKHDSVWTIPIDDNNTQVMCSRMAQAHGGLTGVFFGNSRESSRLPLAFSDYIYSIIVEDTGFIGGAFVLMLYIFLLLRTFMIARRCRRVLPALLVIGMASMITLQALVHMAINTGVFPVSGQPLPLVSKGGTSILVTSVAFAIMISISRTVASYHDKKNIQKEEEELPEELRAENPSQIISFKNEWK